MNALKTKWIAPLLLLIVLLSACSSPAATTEAAIPLTAATETAAVDIVPSATQAAALPTSTAPAATAVATEAGGQSTPSAEAQAAADQAVYEIVTDQSEARYRIREQLANLDLPNDAVGSTKDITGTVRVNADGSIASADSKITVNMATITSDRSQRDNYVRRNILRTDQYPEAVFVPTQVTGLPFPLPDSGNVTFQVIGDLTLLDVTKPVTWEATGVINGDEASGTAVTSFPFEYFNLPQPSVPIVLSVNNEIKLEVDLVVRRVAGGSSDAAGAGAAAATDASSIPATGATASSEDAGPQCTSPAALTPAMTEGPYYKANPPQTGSLYQEGMGGTKLTLTGYVVDTNCQPVPNARVDFWQADAQGVYDNAGYTLRGYQLTDANGRYQLVTVIPGLYPGRTEHIHVKVQAPGGPELTSQLFFPDVAQNQGDRIFDNALLVQNFADGEGGKTATYTFVVQTQ